ncbi:MAG: PD40 domain-containing protein [Thermogemmatispora sp.]|uniref:WD40 repeat domain-containing protein n=1 Tax=Thermogemmatispora sp. TaxID=1968838 RepID=UPI00263743A4|nr:hypothetical protein [Thermogemmatispora sp.]MBX5458963.1 PD40 domain-containing protein [Thermogemmatispora sp.]
MRISRRGMIGALGALGVGASLVGCQPEPLPPGLNTTMNSLATSLRTPVAAGTRLMIIRGPAGARIRDVAWSPNSRLLAYSYEMFDPYVGMPPILRLYDVSRQQALWLYESEIADLIAMVAWSPSGSGLTFLGKPRDQLQMLEVASGNTLMDISDYSGLHAFAWSPDGRRLAMADDDQVSVLDGNSGRVLAAYPPQPPPGGQPSYIVAWSPDGQTIASAGRTHAVQFWEAATGRPLHYFPEQEQAIAAAWSPDGRFLAYVVVKPSQKSDSTSPGQVVVREVRTGRQVLVLNGSFHIEFGQLGEVVYPHSLAWSPDGRYLVTVGQGAEVQVWEVGRQRLALSYRGHRDLVQAVAWAPNGQWIASAGEDGTVQIWQAPGR